MPRLVLAVRPRSRLNGVCLASAQGEFHAGVRLGDGRLRVPHTWLRKTQGRLTARAGRVLSVRKGWVWLIRKHAYSAGESVASRRGQRERCPYERFCSYAATNRFGATVRQASSTRSAISSQSVGTSRRTPSQPRWPT